MGREPLWRRYLNFWRSNPRRDVEDELRFLFDERVDDLVAQGMSREAAQAGARRQFGDMGSVRDELVSIDERMEQRRMRNQWFDSLRQDVRYALRGIRRSPGLAFTVVATVAVGVAAAGSMYGLMWRLLLQPAPHVVEPARVVTVLQTYGKAGDTNRHVNAWMYPFLPHLAASATSYSVVGAYDPMEMSLGSGSGARRIRAVAASGNYWATLGTRPAVGRFFSEAESDPANGVLVAVLSHAFWRGYFAGSEVIGRVVKIAGRSYEIIGVAPRGFRGVDLERVDLWLPLTSKTVPGSTMPWYQSPFSNDLKLIARLAPGVSPQQASTELTTIMRPFLEDVVRQLGSRIYDPSNMRATAASLSSEIGRGVEGRPEAKIAGWLVGVGVVLLAVAATNVAGLLLLRAMRRRREVALRAALGMSHRRLAGLLVTETTIIVLAGGVAGLFLLVTAGTWLERVVFPHLTWESTSPVSSSTILIVAGGVMLTALLASFVALRHSRRDVAMSLRDGAQQGSSRRSGSQKFILTAQTTLSFLLLVGATLFTRSLRNLVGEDVGVDTRRVFSVTVDFSGMGLKRADVGAFYERARERLGVIPGVEHTSLALNAPLLRSARSGGSIYLPGLDTLIRHPRSGLPMINYVTPDFFATTGLRFVRGRTFEETERDTDGVVIVSETMANLYWPNRDPLGECVHVGKEQRTCSYVVGVVRTQHMLSIQEEEKMYWYRPLARTNADIGTVLLRSNLTPRQVTATVRQALQDMQADLPFIDVSELVTGFEAELRPWRLGVTIFTAFGALAMLLAGIGLASAISYSVTERSRELGVRLAVGAQRRDVVFLVLRDGLVIGLAGVATGVLVALASAPLLGDLLYKVPPRDALTFSVVGGAVLLIVLVASSLPARRASRIDPMRVLAGD